MRIVAFRHARVSMAEIVRDNVQRAAVHNEVARMCMA